jgi:WWE domain
MVSVVWHYISLIFYTKFCTPIGWSLYDDRQQAELDAKLKSDTTKFDLTIRGKKYDIDLVTWMQTNSRNGKQRKINHEYPSKVRNLVRPTPRPVPIQQLQSPILNQVQCEKIDLVEFYFIFSCEVRTKQCSPEQVYGSIKEILVSTSELFINAGQSVKSYFF